MLLLVICKQVDDLKSRSLKKAKDDKMKEFAETAWTLCASAVKPAEQQSSPTLIDVSLGAPVGIDHQY